MSLIEKLSKINKDIKAKKEEEEVRILKEEQERLRSIREEKEEFYKYTLEEQLGCLYPKIKKLEKNKFQIELILGSLDLKNGEEVGMGMKEYSLNTEKNFKHQDEELDRLVTGNKEALETLGVKEKKDLLEDPTFDEDIEIIKYKEAKDQKEGLELSDFALKDKLRELGIEIDQKEFSYDLAEGILKEKLEKINDTLKELEETTIKLGPYGFPFRILSKLSEEERLEHIKIFNSISEGDLSGLEKIKIINPEISKLLRNVGDRIYLNNLIMVEGLELPEDLVYGSIFLNRLPTAKGLKIPEIFQGGIYLNGITTTEGLELPESLSCLSASSLTTAEGLEFPKKLDSLSLNGLTTAKGLKLRMVHGCLSLDGLQTAEGLEITEDLEGQIFLNGLTTAEGLEFPEYFKGDIYLNGLTTGKGLKLPEYLRGDLSLNGIATVEGLKLPENIEGNLFLNSLTTAEGLELPEYYLGGDLFLNSLTTAEGLEIPEYSEGHIHLNNLAKKERQKLREKNPKVVFQDIIKKI